MSDSEPLTFFLAACAWRTGAAAGLHDRELYLCHYKVLTTLENDFTTLENDFTSYVVEAYPGIQNLITS